MPGRRFHGLCPTVICRCAATRSGASPSLVVTRLPIVFLTSGNDRAHQLVVSWDGGRIRDVDGTGSPFADVGIEPFGSTHLFGHRAAAGGCSRCRCPTDPHRWLASATYPMTATPAAAQGSIGPGSVLGNRHFQCCPLVLGPTLIRVQVVSHSATFVRVDRGTRRS